MSHYTTLRTRITDQDALVRALEDVGFKKVEVHAKARHLRGYLGDWRLQTAEVIIRRKFVGQASNDIGFKRQGDGTFAAIISDFDRARHSEGWLQRLTQRYAYHTACARLAEKSFNLVHEETGRDGRIHLVLRRMA